MTRSAIEYTPEFVERGYNNRAAVPDHPQWFARWAELSARARDAWQPKLEVRYGPNPKETLDLFVPASPARGTFVFIHGGYWRALDKSDHLFVASPFVAQGYAVAVINYDLCPAVTIATIVEECRRALAWVVRDGGKHGAAAKRIVVGGHSAGGHLAAMLMTTPARDLGCDKHPITGAVSISGVHDLRPLVLFSFNSDLRLDDASARRMSPALLAPQSRAPLCVAVGGDETSEFIRQSELMFNAWPEQQPANASGPLVVRDRHHFSVIVEYADAQSTLTQNTLALF
ncbi:MAG TPA: alpha/beta hydrolase [Casimicrobiaceae bacterium]|nr:alpha/beta hydrolase [Casimicrobiaceae bacterium]